jgi:hypothetical protein
MGSAGLPDEFVKKSPKLLPSHFFVKIDALLFPWKKIPENLGYFCYFQNNCPK